MIKDYIEKGIEEFDRYWNLETLWRINNRNIALYGSVALPDLQEIKNWHTSQQVEQFKEYGDYILEKTIEHINKSKIECSASIQDGMGRAIEYIRALKSSRGYKNRIKAQVTKKHR